MFVHWAGENSDVVIALTKPLESQGKKFKSILYVSRNYGKTFEKQKLGNETINIDRFYYSPLKSSNFIVTDIKNKYIWTSETYLKRTTKHKLKFVPRKISFHPNKVHTIFGFDDENFLTRLWVSEDYGYKWKIVSYGVKEFFLTENTLYVQRTGFVDTNINVYKNNNYIRFDKVLSGVVDFQVKDEYMFATKRAKKTGLELWVAKIHEKFQKTTFPALTQPSNNDPSEANNIEPIVEFYVIDASEGMVMIVGSHKRSDGQLENNLYTSDGTGLIYSLSLRNVVYFNPKSNVSSWLREYVTRPFADVHKVEGLRGYFIASVVNMTNITATNQQSYITMNKGGNWYYIYAPRIRRNGSRSSCYYSWKCYLHLSQNYHSLHPKSRSVPILSKASAPGYVMATGTLGKYMDHTSGRDVNVYFSSDGGYIWRETLSGSHFFEFGDHGGIIVAAEQWEPTNKILYSTDEGESWYPHYFSNEEKLQIYGILTEPGSNTTTFSVFGSLYNKRHSWVLVKVVLNTLFNRTCVKSDYKVWNPKSSRASHCLLGRMLSFKRRIANSNCYNGKTYNDEKVLKNCSCRSSDFECDFGYKKDYLWQSTCSRDPRISESELISHRPQKCPIGSYYYRTKGYRRVAGNTCHGGLAFEYEPEKIMCRSSRLREFMLYSTKSSIYRYEFGVNKTTKVISGLKNIAAVEYDYNENCLYWADTIFDIIQRLCLNKDSKTETLIKQGLDNVESLALDYLGGNLYWIDSGNKRIEMINTRGKFRRVVVQNTKKNPKLLEKPRSIALAPKHGLLFWSDWSANARIMISDMNGQNVKIFVQTGSIKWPNGLAVDESTKRLYWVDGFTKNIKFSTYPSGHTVPVKFKASPHPYAISVFKTEVYWTDWTTNSIYVTDKMSAFRYLSAKNRVFLANITNIMDIKLFSESSQAGNASCSCKYLCGRVPIRNSLRKYPPAPINGSAEKCLCPDTFTKKTVKDNNEICQCEKGETPTKDGCEAGKGDCPKNFFKCDNKKCIFDSWKCDRQDDCGDGSDERNCPKVCTAQQFQCDGGSTCIPLDWKCNNVTECLDKSDEKNCAKKICKSTQFTCGNSECISMSYVCDGDMDCEDGSDEVNCPTFNFTSAKPPSVCKAFQCNSTKDCIPNSWRCDNYKDCPDNSDEIGCKNKCSSTEFSCKTTKICISKSLKCNGYDDCWDGSDEENCPKITTTVKPHNMCNYTSFHCRNHRCIPYSYVCDSINDCHDGGIGSDEESCSQNATEAVITTRDPSVCPKFTFHCLTGSIKCLPSSWVCDGAKDCDDNSDEFDCPTDSCVAPKFFRCSSCILQKQVCDGKVDCADGADERGCSNSTARTCKFDEYNCIGSSLCILRSEICNMFPECPSNEDEKCYSGSFHISSLTSFKKTVKFDIAIKDTKEDMKVFMEIIDMGNPASRLNKTIVYKAKEASHKVIIPNLIPHVKYILYANLIINNTKYFVSDATYRFQTTYEKVIQQFSVQGGDSKAILSWKKPDFKVNYYEVYISNVQMPELSETEQLEITEDDIFGNIIRKTIDLAKGQYLIHILPFTDQGQGKFSPAVQVKIKQCPTVKLIHLMKSLPQILFSDANDVNKLDVKLIPDDLDIFARNLEIKSLKNTYHLKDLSPGMKYTIEFIFHFKGSSDQCSTRKHFKTAGEAIKAPTNIEIEWILKSDYEISFQAFDKKYTYTFYWTSEYKLLDNLDFNHRDVEKISLKDVKTENETITIGKLKLPSCLRIFYMLQVTGPHNVIGELSPIQTFSTREDYNSPPSSLRVGNFKNSSLLQYSADFSWKWNCLLEKAPKSYTMVIGKDDSGDHYSIEVAQGKGQFTKKTIKNLISGAKYHWKVKISGQSSFSEPKSFSYNVIQAPPGFKVFEKGNTIRFIWNKPEYLTEIESYNYIIYKCKNQDEHTCNKLTSIPRGQLDKEIKIRSNHYRCYRIRIKLYESNYPGEFSNPICRIGQVGEHSDKSKSSSNLAIPIAIVAVIVIIVLVAILVFFVMRHRRLQRSLLGYANSIYHSSSGTTVISTDNNLDADDAPIIRGFSDDEPLVVA
ncbi:DgyrCDS7956 [Dimorphilus gyrociliatus]|uniref:DgyrCDS7956 n=1 Tax=Dimorphilus gyrociliatus TaxID=2664684 RepID=A0A7I8VXM8_9ANNE|nr:DgyrCDS7956 [Dimorphilus gyrociliatus]